MTTRTVSGSTRRVARSSRRSSKTTSPTHPRIRARRIEVRRDEGRRRRRRLLGVMAALGFACGVAALVRSPALDVDHITVAGADNTGSAAILRAAAIDRGEPMIEVNGGTVARRLRALPWVREASVRRGWPGTVRIRIVERDAVAQVLAGSRGWAAVDSDGRVLRTFRVPRSDLVPIEGTSAGEPGTSLGVASRPAVGLAALLPPDLAAVVATISTRSGGELAMHLKVDNIRVRVGPPTELEAKVQALAALLGGAQRTPTIKTIDVTVPSASVLTREQPS